MQTMTLDSGRLRLTLATDTGRLRLIELAAPGGPNWAGTGGPLWRLELSGPGRARKELSSDDLEPPALIQGESTITAMFSTGGGFELAVILRVGLANGSAMSVWSLEAMPPDGWKVVRAETPLLSGLAYRDGLKLATPTGWGVARDLAPGLELSLPYPSCTAGMQFLAAYEGGHGLYVAAHDHEAGYKHFDVTASRDGWSAGIADIPSVEQCGGAYLTPFEALVGVFEGAAFEAAQCYRPFALAAPWSQTGPVSRRPIPQWLLDTDLWLKPGETPWTDDDAECRRVTMENVEWCRKAADYFGVPISLHWYRWHQIPYDSLYPEYFPPKAGFVDGVRAAQAAGFRVMPYINGRLCDPESAAWKQGGSTWAVRDAEGEPHTEVYGSNVPLHPMCPATPGWQSTVTGLVARLAQEVGVDGVYIDQIAAAQPFECYASGHPHPRGGGPWWTSAYRDLLVDARRRLPTEGILTSEENAEPWNDVLDALLVVNTPTNEGAVVPLYPAVYSGWVIPFGFQYIPKDEPAESLGFRAKMARAFLWGSQPGWVDAAKVMANHAEPGRRLLRNLARCRRNAHRFLLTGRFTGEVGVAGDNPRLSAECPGSFGGTYRLELPAVVATSWEAEDGGRGVALANMDDAPHTVSLTLPGLTSDFTAQLTDGEGEVGSLRVARSVAALEVPALSALVLSY